MLPQVARATPSTSSTCQNSTSQATLPRTVPYGRQLCQRLTARPQSKSPHEVTQQATLRLTASLQSTPVCAASPKSRRLRAAPPKSAATCIVPQPHTNPMRTRRRDLSTRP
ncbi:hypothetical protein M758_UG224700 [Ceratodon purpureus]|nr:hypothetical protein M758_UG224700 [Ceratodon purpureus]